MNETHRAADPMIENSRTATKLTSQNVTPMVYGSSLQLATITLLFDAHKATLDQRVLRIS